MVSDLTGTIVQVGVGHKEVTCKSKCNEWFASCQDQFFTYAHSSGKLVPCRADDNGPMICTHLGDLVADGEEFCEAMSKSYITCCCSGLPHFCCLANGLFVPV